MQRIDVPAFKGMAPRVSPALLEDVQGVTVTGACTSGELRPWRVPKYVQDCGVDTESIFLTRQGDWLTWDEVVNAVPAVQANDAFGRTYYTRESGGLFVVSPLDDYTEFRVGVPAPVNPCTVGITGGASGNPRSVIYVYSYVNDWGEEGPPSDPTELYDVQDGQTITLSEFAPPPLGYKLIVAIRIYRVAMGEVAAEWFLVSEIPADQATFVDDIPDTGLGEALSTSEYALPPDTARGLIAAGNGVLAAFSGNEIAFCAPYLPYAWPDKFRMTVAEPIVALGLSSGMLAVLTTGSPYYIYMSHPSAARLSPESFGQIRLAETTPCTSPRSVVSTEIGVIFAAPDGLRVLRGDGGTGSTLQTERLLTASEWVAIFDPVNLRGAYYDGSYFGWLGDNGFAYNLRTDVLTWTGLPARATHTDGLGLYIADGGAIYEWAGALGLMRGAFKSKVFRFAKPVNFAALRIDSSMDQGFAILLDNEQETKAGNDLLEQDVLGLADEEILGQSVSGNNLNDLPWTGGDLAFHDVQVWADGVLRFTGEIDSRGYARLPGGFLAREWQFEIKSRSFIKQITLGTSTRAIVGR